MDRRLQILNPDTGFDFPPVESALPEGLLAAGGDLRPERLLAAYRRGIFPWYSEGQPILWWSPDPRAALFPDQLRISRSLAKTLKSRKFRVTLDDSFRKVMQCCALPRTNNPVAGTWITPDMIDSYNLLHELGHAHSVETWNAGKLVGGLYGVSLGGVFFGESMFAHESDASKVAFVHLVQQLLRWGFTLIDCQQYTGHLARFGAREFPRHDFLRHLTRALQQPDRCGRWTFDADIADASVFRSSP